MMTDTRRQGWFGDTLAVGGLGHEEPPQIRLHDIAPRTSWRVSYGEVVIQPEALIDSLGEFHVALDRMLERRIGREKSPAGSIRSHARPDDPEFIERVAAVVARSQSSDL